MDSKESGAVANARVVTNLMFTQAWRTKIKCSRIKICHFLKVKMVKLVLIETGNAELLLLTEAVELQMDQKVNQQASQNSKIVSQT